MSSLRALLRVGLLAAPLIGVACQSEPALRLPEAEAPASTEEGRRAQDLDYMVRVLEDSHPDLYAHVTRAEFKAELDRLHARLPSLDHVGFMLGLARVLAKVGDSHTRLGGTTVFDAYRLPLSFRSYADAIYVVGATKAWKQLFGCELLSMSGLETPELLRRAAVLTPHENQVLLRVNAPNWLVRRCALVELGIVEADAPLELSLRDRSGSLVTASIPADLISGPPAWWQAPNYEPTVLERRKDEPYWSEILGDGRTLYVQYDQCLDWHERPFARFAESILAQLDSGQVDRLVLDLRRNGGGDSRVLRPLRDGLEQRLAANDRKRTFVLIGPGTYSSATMNAIRFRAHAGATLVGEPTSQRPNTFGEVKGFELPNSRTRVDCSTATFRMIRDGDPPTLEPNVHVPTTFEDDYLGRDPVLNWVLAQP